MWVKLTLQLVNAILEVVLAVSIGLHRDALSLALLFVGLVTGVAVDPMLGGWGHGLGHLFVWPGWCIRCNMLVAHVRRLG